MIVEKDKQLLDLKRTNGELEDKVRRVEYALEKSKFDLIEAKTVASNPNENLEQSKNASLTRKINELTDILEQQQAELDVSD